MISAAAVVVTLSTKTEYSPDEEIAFRHVRHYLSRYDKYVLIPDDHAAAYPGFSAKRFPRQFFGSAQAHGKLLLSKRFYRAFLDYEYILVYHLDALVFADELLEWCGRGYDYIGAPWLPSDDTPHIKEQKVGNGGFSLRRVRSFLRVLDSKVHWMPADEYWRRYRERSGALACAFNWPRKYVKRLGWFNDVSWHVRWAVHGDVHEDRFWAEFATHYDPAFRIAPVEVAKRFAFEAEPRKRFEEIGRRLPFGAHRWQKFDRSFYEPYLLRHGPGSEVRRSGRLTGRSERSGRTVGLRDLPDLPVTSRAGGSASSFSSGVVQP